MWLRTCSLEAVVKSLGPKTAAWHGRRAHRVPTAEAAAALSGIDRVPRAFLLLSWGQAYPEDEALCRTVLRRQAAWEAEAEQWPGDRVDALIALCLRELRLGYEAGSMTEVAKAAAAGVSERHWRRAWRERYLRIRRDALEYVGAAQRQLARRVDLDDVLG